VIEVRETRLPGVGKKFTMRTHLGEDVCAVVHIDGRRELYYRPDPDEDADAVIVLSDEEAHELGAILGGVIVGAIEIFGAFYISSNFKDALVFASMFLFLLVRPQGIFGERIADRA
jgi:hypothetical protein